MNPSILGLKEVKLHLLLFHYTINYTNITKNDDIIFVPLVLNKESVYFINYNHQLKKLGFTLFRINDQSKEGSSC